MENIFNSIRFVGQIGCYLLDGVSPNFNYDPRGVGRANFIPSDILEKVVSFEAIDNSIEEDVRV